MRVVLPTPALPGSGCWVYSQQGQSPKHPLIHLYTCTKVLQKTDIAKLYIKKSLESDNLQIRDTIILLINGQYITSCILHKVPMV